MRAGGPSVRRAAGADRDARAHVPARRGGRRRRGDRAVPQRLARLDGPRRDIELPHVPGHELAGTVVETGASVTRWQVGDRVTAPFVLACGRCRTCAGATARSARTSSSRGSPSGARSPTRALPGRPQPGPGPDEVSADVAAGLGCRFATAYRPSPHVGRVQPGETVVVHGCGGVGLAAVMVAVALGARVLAVDPDPASLALAEQLGAVRGAGRPQRARRRRRRDHRRVRQPREPRRRARLAAAARPARPGRACSVAPTPPAASTSVGCSRLELSCSAATACRPRRYPELLALVADGTLDPGRLMRDRIGLAEAGPRLAALGLPGAGAGGVTVIRPDLG